ncbi:TPA: hypothetical protein NHQ80_003431 [Pseudomonas aeruginosa]|uniref:hypothetical protein n=1 Tax=Pseudomonas TaxID=286 RepID=UPI000AB5529A|nr:MULTISPECIES: hypothetical protein [Pseudomonas]EIZ7652630.1 hypothetical protein [Pseudomonas aeruginosa]EJK6089177.1 hypothetical protein [Pseudomonas aeruginosa]EKD5500717.1 hypothetical protein [Pseudomonas aeruginosa]EKD5528600.1 hypothetical protein [Pseudomonas aeruginosa]EKD5567080.1 hypothetical protein [Pseudomonas aeruginosa]
MSGRKVAKILVGQLLVIALIIYTQTSASINPWIVSMVGTAALWLGYFAGEEL